MGKKKKRKHTRAMWDGLDESEYADVTTFSDVERQYLPTYPHYHYPTFSTEWCGDLFAPMHMPLPPVAQEVKPVEPTEWKCEYCGAVNVLAECSKCGAPKPLATTPSKEEILEAITKVTEKKARELLEARDKVETNKPKRQVDFDLIGFFLILAVSILIIMVIIYAVRY